MTNYDDDNPNPWNMNFDQASADRATMLGVVVIVSLLAIGFFWHVAGWLVPFLILGLAAYILYHYRATPFVLWLRNVVIDRLVAIVLRRVQPRAYEHAFEERQHEQQADDVGRELARVNALSGDTSAEAAIFRSNHRGDMEARVAMLLDPSKTPQPLTRGQQRELDQLLAWIKEERRAIGELIDDPPPSLTIRPLMQAEPANGFLSVLSSAFASWHLWLIGGLAALSGLLFAHNRVLDARGDRLAAERTAAVEDRDYWHSRTLRTQQTLAAEREQFARNALRYGEELRRSATYAEQQRRIRAQRERDLRSIQNAANPDAGGNDPADSLSVLRRPVDPGPDPGAGPADPSAGSGL